MKPYGTPSCICISSELLLEKEDLTPQQPPIHKLGEIHFHRFGTHPIGYKKSWKRGIVNYKSSQPRGRPNTGGRFSQKNEPHTAWLASTFFAHFVQRRRFKEGELNGPPSLLSIIAI